MISGLNSGITDSAIAVYAEDATVMPNQGPAGTGIAAIRAWLDGAFSQVTMTHRIIDFSVEVVGDLAVDRYAEEFTLTFKAIGAGPMTEPVKGVNVYRRQADGSWKVTTAIWNPDERP
jgi:ketosteroid isomerase-like protein